MVFKGILIFNSLVMITQSSTVVRKFERNSDFDDMDCLVEDVLSVANVTGVLQCLRLCTNLGEQCQSIFYQKENGVFTCHSCKRTYDTYVNFWSMSLPSLPGSLHYYLSELIFVCKKLIDYTKINLK